MIFKVFFLGSPSVFLQPGKLLGNRFFKFLPLVLCTECNKCLIFVIILKWIKSWLEIVSYFGFFLQIIFMLFIPLDNFFETLYLFLRIFFVFCEGMTNFNKGLFILDLKVINNLFDVSRTLSGFFWFFLLAISIILLISFFLSTVAFSFILATFTS